MADVLFATFSKTGMNDDITTVAIPSYALILFVLTQAVCKLLTVISALLSPRLQG